MTAETGDGTNQHCLEALSLTDLPADVASDSIVRRPAHEAQCFAYSLLWKQVQERGLSEMHRERLPESAVKHRLAGCVDEISNQYSVTLGKRMRIAVVEVKCRGRCNQHDERDDGGGELVTFDSPGNVLSARRVRNGFLRRRHRAFGSCRRNSEIADFRSRVADGRRRAFELRFKLQSLLEPP